MIKSFWRRSANTMYPRRRPYGTLMLGLQLSIGLRGGGQPRQILQEAVA